MKCLCKVWDFLHCSNTSLTYEIILLQTNLSQKYQNLKCNSVCFVLLSVEKAPPAAEQDKEVSAAVSTEVMVSSSSEAPTEKSAKSGSILKNKGEPAPLPDSSNSKSKQPKLVAYFGGSSEESATDSSEDSDSSDEEDRKKKAKMKKKRGKEEEEEDNLDIDDIDKALEMALEKKVNIAV